MAIIEPVPAQAPPRASALSPLRIKVFRNVWIASVLGSLGWLIQSVGASWLMISIAPRADMVALVQGSVSLPIMLLALVAGAMADNYDRRKVMLGAQVFMLVVSLLLMACTLTGLITPWLLLLFTFAIGCGAAFHSPTWQASVGDMVPRSELASAVALNSMGFNMARSVGPALGGVIVAAAGAAAAFAVNAASYIALIFVLARWRSPAAASTLPREGLGLAMAAGVRYVAMSPAILRVLLRSALFGLAAGAVMALLPMVAKELLQGGPLTYGLLLGAFGLGAVGGALLSDRVRRNLSTEATVRWSSAGLALAAVVIALSSQLLLSMAALLIAGAGWLLALATFNVAVQLSAPRWVVARALSIYQMAAFSGLAAGSLLWGEVATDFSIPVALLAAAASMLACAALGWWVPLAQTEDLNLELMRTWKEPSTAVPIDARTGPVVVTVEYRIPEERLTEFLAAMSAWRRIRRRDGARNWRLLRDLADPLVWIERYEAPTWLEYVRHNSRMTHHDGTVPQRLLALHQGPERPRVRRMIERPSTPPVAGRETMLDQGRLS